MGHDLVPRDGATRHTVAATLAPRFHAAIRVAVDKDAYREAKVRTRPTRTSSAMWRAMC